GAVGVISRLPRPLAWGLGGAVGAVAWLFWRGYRRLARTNVRIVFGNTLSPREQNRLVFRSALNIVREFFESVKWLRLSPDQKRARFTLEGKEHLEAAQAGGKGAIILSAHMSNFPLLSVAFTHSGFPNVFVMRQIKVRKTDAYFDSLEKMVGVEVIDALPRERCAIECIRKLKAGTAVIMALDLDDRDAKVFVDFFGEKASCYTGPIVLARRTGAALVPAFIFRDPDRRYRCVIHPPIPLPEGEEDCLPALEEYNRILESYVRRLPEQWPWIYKRWRTRPPGEPPIYRKGY
ncbi:MAG: lysophospholipid acyltransferase family protein, partial [Candidatus Aureabacteria bacterium]|nr:lysophospholipid acyltransferase family protein [Candidatus Auribacterota bacterium]